MPHRNTGLKKYAGIPRLKSEKEVPRELKHSPISLRILNALHTIGITRFSDFSNHTRDEIHAIPGIGPRAMLELDKELKKRGIHYKQNHTV